MDIWLSCSMLANRRRGNTEAIRAARCLLPSAFWFLLLTANC